MIWFQTNGQFIWKWFDSNPLILSAVGGTTISYTIILGTKFAYEHFGEVWPGRFICFAIGIAAYAVLTSVFMGESINIKTATSLLLSLSIISIQLFWK